jgi:hypothetical protein
VCVGCVYVCLCVRAYLCMCAFVSMCARAYMCMCTFVSICVHVYVCFCEIPSTNTRWQNFCLFGPNLVSYLLFEPRMLVPDMIYLSVQRVRPKGVCFCHDIGHCPVLPGRPQNALSFGQFLLPWWKLCEKYV